MSQYDYDLFVIGAGSGGVRAARVAAGHGARVGICEQSRPGGTCVIRGCVPKKLLAYAAHYSEDFEDAEAYGWTSGPIGFSWPRLRAAKDREIDRLEGVYRKLLEQAGARLIEGRGVLAGPHVVRVGDEVVRAEKILVAAGGRPWVPDIEGRDLTITSDDVFDLPELPDRVVIVGGGYVACEFASIFNGLGAEVTLVYRGDAVLRGFDHDVRRALGRELAGKGVALRLETRVTGVRETDPGLEVMLDDGARLTADCVLYATGRVPNTARLRLSEADVAVRADGSIPVDEYSRTNVEHIFAVGDITHRVNLTPVAIHEGHAFADTQFGGIERPVDHAFVPSAVFSHPPVGTVGHTEHEADIYYGEIDVYRSEFTPMKHTLTGRGEKTMMKLVVERSRRKVVGLHVVGQDAPEIVQGFAVAVKSGLTKDQFDATIGIHPTAAEELVTMRDPVQG